MKLSIKKQLTFSQRFTRLAIYWGIPMVCLELLGIPIFGWPVVLAIVVPATLAGVLAGTIFEHLLITYLAKKLS
jgi:hypothetical protein